MSQTESRVQFNYINDEKITNVDLKNIAVQEQAESRGPVVIKHASEISVTPEITGATEIQHVITKGRTQR